MKFSVFGTQVPTVLIESLEEIRISGHRDIRGRGYQGKMGFFYLYSGFGKRLYKDEEEDKMSMETREFA